MTNPNREQALAQVGKALLRQVRSTSLYEDAKPLTRTQRAGRGILAALGLGGVGLPVLALASSDIAGITTTASAQGQCRAEVPVNAYIFDERNGIPGYQAPKAGEPAAKSDQLAVIPGRQQKVETPAGRITGYVEESKEARVYTLGPNGERIDGFHLAEGCVQDPATKKVGIAFTLIDSQNGQRQDHFRRNGENGRGIQVYTENNDKANLQGTPIAPVAPRGSQRDVTPAPSVRDVDIKPTPQGINVLPTRTAQPTRDTRPTPEPTRPNAPAAPGANPESAAARPPVPGATPGAAASPNAEPGRPGATTVPAGSAAACEIDSATFNPTKADEGQQVEIKVVGKGDCNGQDVTATLVEQDTIDNDERVDAVIPSAKFAGNAGQIRFAAVWQDDSWGVGGGDPEFRAQVFLVARPSKTVETSNELEVSQVTAISGASEAEGFPLLPVAAGAAVVLAIGGLAVPKSRRVTKNILAFAYRGPARLVNKVRGVHGPALWP